MHRRPKVLLESATKVYASDKEDIIAVSKLDLAVSEGEVVSIVGPSGCGKTTALNLVAGFVRATEGSVLVDGRAPVPGQGSVGVVFQADSVFPWMSVGDNVGYGLSLTARRCPSVRAS